MVAKPSEHQLGPIEPEETGSTSGVEELAARCVRKGTFDSPRTLRLSDARTRRLSFREQIDGLRGASAVVAPHGAGLTNILFAPNQCRVLELFASRGGTLTYEVLAKALGQDYTALRDHGPAPTFAAEQNDMAITVDLDAVEDWLLGVSQ